MLVSLERDWAMGKVLYMPPEIMLREGLKRESRL